MLDAIYLIVIGVFALLSWTLIAVCEQLMGTSQSVGGSQ